MDTNVPREFRFVILQMDDPPLAPKLVIGNDIRVYFRILVLVLIISITFVVSTGLFYQSIQFLTMFLIVLGIGFSFFSALAVQTSCKDHSPWHRRAERGAWRSSRWNPRGTENMSR